VKIEKRDLPYLLLLIAIVITFYWKVFIKGLVPFPGDLLVGAYYPWLDYKWGYEVGVPIKNPLISDIFSQTFIWKSLIIESYKNLQWPLWNPYEYSGIPLLANFQSGSLNPFNLLMLLGEINGWTLMIIAQSLGSIIAFYLFLRSLKITQGASVLGSISYTFSTFAMTWSQFANLGFAMIWLPLILLVINKYFEKGNHKYLLIIVPLVFLSMSAGHLQAFIFTIVIYNLFFIFKMLEYRRKDKTKKVVFFVITNLIAFASTAIQILPTYELSLQSIRFKEKYIEGYNYGLLPPKHLITLMTPNFFGNPATGNYWGFFNYHETTIYSGLVGIFAIIWSIKSFKKLPSYAKFFTITAISSLLLIFDNPVSKLFYQSGIPFISTSSASRSGFILCFSVAVLIGVWSERIKDYKLSSFIEEHWMVIAFIFLQFLILIFYPKLTKINLENEEKIKIAIRNTIPTLGIATGILTIFSLKPKKTLFFTMIIFITTAELFYYNWKYIPLTKKDFVYPQTEIIKYLKEKSGLGRVESERGPLLPANTWVYYRLHSISGYEPLASERYVNFYQKNISKQEYANPSRYSTMTNNYDAELLGKLSVKYLLSLEYDEEMEIAKHGKNFSRAINTNDWKEAYDYGSVRILENKKYKERARIENQKGKIVGSATISRYSPNEVIIRFSSPENANLVLTDSYSEDWKAQINNRQSPVERYLDVFRAVKIPEGEGVLRFYYHPKSFYNGLIITIASFSIWLILTTLSLKTKKTN